MGIAAYFRKRAFRKAIDRLRAMTVGDLMSPHPVSMGPNDTVIHAATKMIAEDISCMVVMDGEELAGIFSERDFLMKVPLNRKVFDMRIKDIMTGGVVTVPPSMPLTDAVALMKKKNFRRLVVADGGKVLGIVTQTDFSKAIHDAFASTPSDLIVGTIMSDKVLTANPKDSFSSAREKMKKINVGSILIVDKGEPLGIFTEYDVVMQFYDQEGQLSIKELSAYMKRYVRAAAPALTIVDANRLLLEKRMRRLPIVDGSKVVGIVTQTDIVRYVFTNLDAMRKACDAGKLVPLRKRYDGEFVGEHLKVY